MYTGDNDMIGPLNESTYIDNPDVPLGLRMVEHLPGISTAVAFGSFRGSNTMMYGGFMDDLGDPQKILSARRQKRMAKRASKHRLISGGQMSAAADSHFMGSASRAANARAAGKTPFLRSSRVNNATLNPRAFFRAHSQTIFAGESAGAYSMFGGYKMLNSKYGNRLAKRITGESISSGEKAFGPGLLSGIAAGVKTDALERRALKGSSRAAAKLARIDNATASMLRMNNPALASKFIAPTLGSSGGVATLSNQIVGASYGQAGTVGVRGNLQASALTGAATGVMAGYARGSLGYGRAVGYQGLSGNALKGAKMAEKQFVTAFGRAGLGTRSLAYEALQPGNLIKTLKATDSGIIKGLSSIAAKGGGKALAMRGAALAVPGVQVLAAASLAFDLAQMGGELVKSGINFVRDANKSLQGSIAKPTFGMGYKDTEAAATSRARGVAAIQNSRLNARSMLGTEAAMMAARYG